MMGNQGFFCVNFVGFLFFFCGLLFWLGPLGEAVVVESRSDLSGKRPKQSPREKNWKRTKEQRRRRC